MPPRYRQLWVLEGVVRVHVLDQTLYLMEIQRRAPREVPWSEYQCKPN